MIRGMLIDVDGTLVLSNDAHARAWIDAFSEYGYSIQFEQIRPLIGMGSDKIIPTLLPNMELESDTIENISKKREEIFQKKYIQIVKPAPGVQELTNKLKKLQIKTTIASSGNPKDVESLLKIAGVSDLLPDRTSSADVTHSKPDPDLISAALKNIDLPAQEVLMLGDTPYDIVSAQSCGVGVIAVRCGGFSDSALSDAVSIYDDPGAVANDLESILNRGAKLQ